jgi:hypothetical protein
MYCFADRCTVSSNETHTFRLAHLTATETYCLSCTTLSENLSSSYRFPNIRILDVVAQFWLTIQAFDGPDKFNIKQHYFHL